MQYGNRRFYSKRASMMMLTAAAPPNPEPGIYHFVWFELKSCNSPGLDQIGSASSLKMKEFEIPSNIRLKTIREYSKYKH